MSRTALPVLAALVALAAMPVAAAAADLDRDGPPGAIKIWKPYVIEKNCVEDFNYCRVRMDYAPFQHATLAKPGSYWYQKPFQHYHYYDHLHDTVSTSHEAWCSERYRTYDPASDTYVGKGMKRYRCNSPYDGR